MEEKDKKVQQKIKVTPPQPPQTNIDLDQSLEDTILQSAIGGDLQQDVFESFSTTAQNRESEYELIDTMAMDSTIAAAIETYAEDMSQPNSKGETVWCESDDTEVSNYVSYILKKINVDKQIFSWAYNLTKYGDVYVRLLRESDFTNSKIFGGKAVKEAKETLNEDVNINVTRPGDHYAFTVEMVKNPNEMFELTKYGKSVGYVKAGVNVQSDFKTTNTISYFTTYKMRKSDVDIYAPTEFVHACLQGSTSRADEELDLFLNADDYDKNTNSETFQVRRGTGILNDLFKVWRQLSLLENSVLLNRLTRSSIVRAIQLEVGDMPANQVSNVTSRVKNLIENKSALDVGKNMSEYTNPGPMENIIIIPTRNGKGALTINQIGGEVDPKQLTDLDWYNNKLFGGLKIPKQYFGWTDDAGGFSAGTSLSQYSSRYGKAVKRMQAALIDMITDMINLILIDAGYPRYVNRFKIRMQAPITQEELDQKADLSNTLRNVSDIMNTLSDIENKAARLKILKALLSQCLADQDISNILQEEIDKLEAEETVETSNSENTLEPAGDESEFEDLPFPTRGGEEERATPDTFESPEEELSADKQSTEPEAESAALELEPSEEPADNDLPTFDTLGIDGTKNK